MLSPIGHLVSGTASGLSGISRRRWLRSGNGCAEQEAIFGRLMEGFSTSFLGKQSGIVSGLCYDRFRAGVPTRTYEGFSPYLERMLKGESDVLWPGRCSYFAVSSGTTAGRTKYIPVNRDMLAHFRSTGLDSLMMYASRTGRYDVFAGRQLFLGGSTVLAPIPRGPGLPEAFAGDLSGITAMNLPSWAEALLYEPGRTIAQMGDWPEKIRAIAERTMGKDLRLIAGIPSWILVLAEAMRRRAAEQGMKALTLQDIWPNLRCLVHGGVPVAPFAGELRAALGPNVDFHEVYPASEGFIAAQDAESEAGLRLFTGAGIFYEFAPLDKFNETMPESLSEHAVPLEGVQTGRDYVLIMTTPGGFCRYIIGDVVRFLSTDIPRLVYAGRTKLQLSAFGEHVIEKELTDSLVAVSKRLGFTVVNFHVAPLFVDSREGVKRGRHEWWIAAKEPGAGRSREIVSRELDLELARRNEDYEAKRLGLGLDTPLVRLVPPEVFEAWMRSKGKWGGQSKMPRCRSDRSVADELAALACLAPAPEGQVR